MSYAYPYMANYPQLLPIQYKIYEFLQLAKGETAKHICDGAEAHMASTTLPRNGSHKT